MPANEIQNRLAAAGWIKFTGDEVGVQFALRSQVSCQNRLLLMSSSGAGGSLTFAECPLIIVPLDRTLSRRETSIIVQKIETSDAVGHSYPFEMEAGYFTDNTVIDQRVLTQPFHMDWLGDPANPSWAPFDLGALPDVDPLVFDLDLYNAVAFLGPLLELEDSDPIEADFCFVIFQHPKVDAETTIQETLLITGPG